MTYICPYCGKERSTRACCGEVHNQEVHVSFVCPPIPDRSSDYSATFDSYEPGDPIGWGATRESAIDDLLEQRCV